MCWQSNAALTHRNEHINNIIHLFLNLFHQLHGYQMVFTVEESTVGSEHVYVWQGFVPKNPGGHPSSI